MFLLRHFGTTSTSRHFGRVATAVAVGARLLRVGLVAVASGRGTYCGLPAVLPHLSVSVLGDTTGPMPALSRLLILG
eukprot:COSAG01_NODE_42223_length_442_cov_0.912536_1_plen_76_part_01